MGFRCRRSFKIVPGVRLNLSASGASLSFGPRGLQYTVGPHGTRTTVGLPGSGISWTAYQPYSSPTPPPVPAAYDKAKPEQALWNQGVTVIDSAHIGELVANSTIDLAQALAAGRSRWRTFKVCIAVLTALLVIAAINIAASNSSVPPLAAFIMAAGAVIILGTLIIHGRESSAVTLSYELSANQTQRFETLARAFGDLEGCSRVWNIPLEKQETDWKRNAGASKTIQRHKIRLSKENPALVTTNVKFLKLPLGKETIYLTPDAILVVAGNEVAGFNYDDIDVTYQPIRFIEEETAPSDTTVVDQTWRYVNKKGGPDRRFNDNRQLPVCLYGEIDLRSASGLNERIQCSRPGAAEQFVLSMAAMSAAAS